VENWKSMASYLTWRRRIQHLYTHRRPPHACNMTMQDPSNYLCQALHFIKFRLSTIIHFLACLIDYHQYNKKDLKQHNIENNYRNYMYTNDFCTVAT
jgi:hypothetical protein